MKLLRILTGNQAGAQARLSPGTYRIDSDDDADIRITDWNGPEAIINVNDTGIVSVKHALALEGEDAEDANSATVLMLDFLPMPFDQTVLCIGPDDTAWPTDLALLSTLLLKPEDATLSEKPSAAKRRAKGKTFVALGAACAVLVVAVCIATLSLASHAKASLLPRDVAAMEAANQALRDAQLGELHASLDGHGGLVLKGMVANENEDISVRRLLPDEGLTPIHHEYSVAETTARSIQEALSLKGIGVRYIGRGVFSITGNGIDMDALQQNVQRVRADLPATVKALRIDATGAERSADAPIGASYTSIVSSDNVRYAQTADGVKHIFMIPDPAQGASDSASASDTASASASASATVSASVRPTAGTSDTVHALDTASASANANMGVHELRASAQTPTITASNGFNPDAQIVIAPAAAQNPEIPHVPSY